MDLVQQRPDLRQYGLARDNTALHDFCTAERKIVFARWRHRVERVHHLNPSALSLEPASQASWAQVTMSNIENRSPLYW